LRGSVIARSGVPRAPALLVIGALLAFTVAPLAPRAAAAADVGYQDGGYSGSAPTAREPQSKLWFNDGTWWASMYSSSAGAVDIQRLNWATQTWSDTGVRIDERSSSFADTLWDGSKLYIVTGVSDQSLSCSPSTSGDNSIRILRFSYNASAKTYSLDTGYPVTLASLRVQSVSISKDSTGTLWATWAYPTGSSTGSVFVTHSSTDTAHYVAPYVVPLPGATTMECGDYSAIVAYSGKIGVMWSNQNTSTMYFGVHVDGDQDTSWAANNAASGTGWADNHVNLKSLVADPAGQVFAAMKTSLNGDQCPPSSGNAGNPLIVLVFLDNTGGWQRRTFSTAADCETRPLVQIDPEHRQLYLFATYPPPGASYGSGGSIYYKVTSLDNPNFTSGPGTPFIQLAADPSMNNVSGTKQPLGSATGLVVLAADDSTHKYVHNAMSLGADTTPPTVTSTTPANGATNVAINATVNATYSEPMNASTITSSTFTLTDTTTSAAVPASVSYNGGTNTATLAPNSALPTSHAFSATIKGGVGGVTDLAGNAMASDYTWTFTSMAPDTTPPNVTLTAPTNGATVSGTSVSLSATASDNVAVDHVNFLLNGTVIATDTVSPYTATWNSTTVPNGPASIAAQAFDAATNQASSSASVTVANTPPFSDGFESGNFNAWSLVKLGGDGTATVQPSVVNTGVYAAKLTESGNNNSLSYIRKSLSSDQTELTISGDFQVSSTGKDVPLIRLFDSAGARRFSLYRVNSGGGISYTDGLGTVATGSILPLNTWVHVDLHLIAGSGNATVQVTVNGTLVSSSTSRTLTATRTLQLGNETKKQTMTLYADNISVTGPITVQAPDTTITSGPSGTVNTSSASLAFTSTMPGSTFTCSLDGAAATTCTSPVAYSGLADGSHTFSVAATANGATDPTPATASWTVDTAPPVSTSTNPAAGATGVPTSSTVTATFNEAMSASTITTSTFTLKDTTLNSGVAATVAYNANTKTATLTPSASLTAGDTLQATVKGGGGGVTDLAGNPMASDLIWSFTTTAAVDGQPPTVTLTAPAQGGTVSGSSVALSADANDNVQVDHVDFLVGSTVVATDSSAPYTATWDSTSVSDGPVTITARAYDTSQNQASDSHSVTVSNGGSGSLFSDGFESGNLNNWTLVKTGGDGSATVQSTVVKTGSFAARLSESSTSGSLAYARETLSADQTSLTVTGDFQVFAEGTSAQNVPFIRLFNSAGTRLVSLFRQSASGNKVYVGYGGTNYLTSGLLPLNTWGTFQLRIVTGTGNATVQVSINGSLVYSNTSATLAAIRTLQIGNDTAAQPMGMYVDNIVVTSP
jgi:Bacterial Ig-like domain/Bacterial Ig domain